MSETDKSETTTAAAADTAPPSYAEAEASIASEGGAETEAQATADEDVDIELITEGVKAMDAAEAAGDEVNPFVASLPEAVQAKVAQMRTLHEERVKLEEQFEEERRALLFKYQGLEAPINTQRKQIVTEGEGIKGFWLQAFKNCSFIGDCMIVGEKDEDALEHLVDVRCFLMEDARSFKFEFEFSPNPFFEDTVLTKTYEFDEDNDPVGAKGHEINWKPGKNLTVKLKKKKKGGKNRPAITKTEPCETFFNWFSPPQMPDEDDESMDEQAEEDLEEALEQDLDLGMMLKDKILPHAIMYFVGENVDTDDESDEDDSEDDSEDDEDDSDDDDEPPARSGRGRGRGRGGSGGQAAASTGAVPLTFPGQPQEGNPECKQQ